MGLISWQCPLQDLLPRARSPKGCSRPWAMLSGNEARIREFSSGCSHEQALIVRSTIGVLPLMAALHRHARPRHQQNAAANRIARPTRNRSTCSFVVPTLDDIFRFGGNYLPVLMFPRLDLWRAELTWPRPPSSCHAALNIAGYAELAAVGGALMGQAAPAWPSELKAGRKLHFGQDGL